MMCSLMSISHISYHTIGRQFYCPIWPPCVSHNPARRRHCQLHAVIASRTFHTGRPTASAPPPTTKGRVGNWRAGRCCRAPVWSIAAQAVMAAPAREGGEFSACTGIGGLRSRAMLEGSGEVCFGVSQIRGLKYCQMVALVAVLGAGVIHAARY